MVGKHGMETPSTRRGRRYRVVVNIKVADLGSRIQIEEHTKDLSLCGCGVTTATPFPAGTTVMLKVAYGVKQIEAFGRVIYGRPDIGMGIVFTAIEPKSKQILEDWFAD
jgi:hypothetical protein